VRRGNRQGFPSPDQEEKKMEEKIKDLNLLLMYLTGWEEDSRQNQGEKVLCTWKGYNFKTLNQFADEKLIIQFKDKNLVILTELGRQKAENLKKQYLS
jgi:hypothetical protein